MIFITISILLLIALIFPSVLCSKSKESASVVSSVKDTEVETQDVEEEFEESDEEG